MIYQSTQPEKTHAPAEPKQPDCKQAAKDKKPQTLSASINRWLWRVVKTIARWHQ